MSLPVGNWYPNVKGKADDTVDIGFRKAFDSIYNLQSQVNDLSTRQTNTTLTLDQLQQIQASLQQNGSTPLNLSGLPGLGTQASVIEDTHVNRVRYPASQNQRVLFFEVDRFSLYLSVVSSGQWVWLWIAGTLNDATDSLTGKPTDLVTTDQGFLYRSAFFGRVWRWSGSQWNYSDGSLGAGALVTTVVTLPAFGPPLGGLWQECDGSVVSIAHDDATLSNVAAVAPAGFIGTAYMRR